MSVLLNFYANKVKARMMVPRTPEKNPQLNRKIQREQLGRKDNSRRGKPHMIAHAFQEG